MTWRHVAAYWLGAALLGGWLWADFRWQSEEPVGEATLAPLLEGRAVEIDDIAIVGSAGTIRFALSSGRWETTDPAGASVTSDLVAALLDTLSSIPPIEKLVEAGHDTPQFGLAPAQTRLVLSRRGETLREIEIGKRNPTRTAAYAAIAGENAVYLIGLNAQYYLELIFDEVARQRLPNEG